MAPPQGYTKLASGLRCRCVNLWQEGDDFYCCKLNAPPPMDPPDELELLRETKDALCERINRLQDEGAELRRQYAEAIDALRGYRAAFANRGETTSLHDWNQRLKQADEAAAKFV